MRFFCLAGFVLAALITPAKAQESYPARTITMIVPFAAGGSTDAIGRVVAEGMSQALGQRVVVENRGGAGGTIGTAAIAKAEPDGYTIGMGTASTLAINPATYKNLTFDVLTDLVPVGEIAAVPNILSVNPTVDAKDIAAFIALAKSRPGALSYASAGPGSVSHLLGEQFKLATGTDLVHVPYRGVGPALVDAVGGQVQAVFDNLPTSLPLVRDGRLRALGVSGETRVADLPDVPTFAELGLPDLNWMAFFGIVAPKGTPAPVIAKLNAALVAALAMPRVAETLASQKAIVVGGTPEAFATKIAAEKARMARAVAAANIKAE